jgi:hypothetical protein
MKRKLCPFDKLECVGEPCMLFSREKEMCNLLLGSPGNPPGQEHISRKTGSNEPDNNEKKSRFKAELFD